MSVRCRSAGADRRRWTVSSSARSPQAFLLARRRPEPGPPLVFLGPGARRRPGRAPLGFGPGRIGRVAKSKGTEPPRELKSVRFSVTTRSFATAYVNWVQVAPTLLLYVAGRAKPLVRRYNHNRSKQSGGRQWAIGRASL